MFSSTEQGGERRNDSGKHEPKASVPNTEDHTPAHFFPLEKGTSFLGAHSTAVTEDLLAPINDFPSFRINTRRWISRYCADTEFSETINTLYHANRSFSTTCVKTEDEGQLRPSLQCAGGRGLVLT